MIETWRIVKRRFAEGDGRGDALGLLDDTARWEDESVGFENVSGNRIDDMLPTQQSQPTTGLPCLPATATCTYAL